MPSHYGGNGRMNGNNGRRTTRSSTNNNPVTELFNAPQSPRYYRPNGSVVPIGAPLHRHADGTIMTEHSMGLNDNSQVVTTTRNATASRTPNRRVNRAQYTFVDTGEQYSGRVVDIGGILYTTTTGTKEGTSRVVERSTISTNTRNIRRALPRRNRTIRTRNNTRTINRPSTRMATNTNRRRSTRRVNRQTTNMNNGMRTRNTTAGSTRMRTTRTTRRSGGY